MIPRSTVLAVGLLLAGCGGDEPGFQVGSASAEGCDLSLDSLAGDTYVMQMALPDGKTTKEEIQARMKFVEKEGKLTAQYTVMSVSDVYDYPCVKRGEGDDAELYCAEEERLADWCQALEVHEAGSCTRASLKELGASADDETLKAKIKEAKQTVKKYRNTENWDQFVLNNNNLGNKLQGRLYIKADTKRCRLQVGDFYFTIYNGKKVEDTNPVGQNPFVKTDEVLLFEHCKDGRSLADLTTEVPPKDLSKIPPRRNHSTGTPVHYWYLGEKEVEPAEGCTYDFDVWAQWRPVAEKQATELGKVKRKDVIKWHYSHTYTPETLVQVTGKDAAIFHMIRYKTCGGGEREKIDVVCNAALMH